MAKQRQRDAAGLAFFVGLCAGAIAGMPTIGSLTIASVLAAMAYRVAGHYPSAPARLVPDRAVLAAAGPLLAGWFVRSAR